MLAALASRRRVESRVALVVAHPDDETLAVGGSLHLMPDLLLVHVTDGAPRRLADIARNGFLSPAAYARARADELALALALSEADPVRACLDLPDQDAVDHLADITAHLRTLFTRHRIDCALTHAYEGGHPDHDAVAFAVHMTGVPVFEFAGYHADAQGRMITHRFSAGDQGIAIDLAPSELTRKRAMLDCFRTQSDMLAHFDPATEHYRPAPRYDFDDLPNAGHLLYAQWGWLDGATWRARAERSRCLD